MISTKITAIHRRVTLSLDSDSQEVCEGHNLPSWIRDIHWNFPRHASTIRLGWLRCPHLKLRRLIANNPWECVRKAHVARIFASLVNLETTMAVPFMPVLDGPNRFIPHYLSQLYAKGHFV